MMTDWVVVVGQTATFTAAARPMRASAAAHTIGAGRRMTAT